MRLVSVPRRRGRCGQAGGTAVEFALVFPILFLFLLGVIDVSRLLIYRCMLQYAVIVGARAGVAMINASTGAVQTAAVNAAPMLHLTAGTVSVTTTAGTWSGRSHGDKVIVSYSGYAFTPASGSFARLVPKNLSATSTQTIP